MKIYTAADISDFPCAQALRIPCVVAHKKDVFALFECRFTRSDWASISLIMKHSADGGQSFGEPTVFADGQTENTTYNNPVAALDGDGVLHTVFCREYGVRERNGGVFYRTFTRRNGLSETKDISNIKEKCECNVFAAGPTAAVFTQNGDFAVPVWYVPKKEGGEPTSHHPGRVRMLFGKNGCRDWELGEEIPLGKTADPNESSAAELPDGSFYISIRDNDTRCRCFSVCTADGRGSPIQTEPALPDPVCCGAVCSARYNGVDYLLMSNCADAEARRNLCVSLSVDGGKTWVNKITVEAGDAGYSDIAFNGEDSVFVLFESDGGRSLKLAKIGMVELIATQTKQ